MQDYFGDTIYKMTKTHTITIKSLDDLFKLSSQDLKKVLDKFGIKDERGFLSKLFSKDSRTEELKTVLNKIKHNQEIYEKLTWQGKLAVLLDFNNDTFEVTITSSSNKSLKLKERYFKLKNVLMQFQKMYGNGYTMTPKDINKNLVYKKLFQKIGVNTVDQFINKKFWNGRIIDRLKRDGIYQRFCKLIDWYWQINGYDREKAKIQSLLHVAAEHNYNEYYNDLEVQLVGSSLGLDVPSFLF
jgi:hypothetical protein